MHNVGVGLVIAAGGFAGTPAVSAVFCYEITEDFGYLLLAVSWGAGRVQRLAFWEE
jgi:hypothetical protein